MREEKEDIQTEKKSLWSQSCQYNNVQLSSWILNFGRMHSRGTAFGQNEDFIYTIITLMDCPKNNGAVCNFLCSIWKHWTIIGWLYTVPSGSLRYLCVDLGYMRCFKIPQRYHQTKLRAGEQMRKSGKIIMCQTASGCSTSERFCWVNMQDRTSERVMEQVSENWESEENLRVWHLARMWVWKWLHKQK